MVTLQPVLQTLGYRSEVQQRDFIKLLAAAGAFGELPGVTGTLNDRQAQAVLASVNFNHAAEAANWLHDVTQEHMLRRPPGVERWACEEPDTFRQNRGELLNALHHLGMLAEVKPQAKHYDHALVLGSQEGAVSTRLDLLKELYDQGVRFDHIHLLGSERKLDAAHEPMANVATEAGSVATEMQMMTARAYEKSESWPEELQKIKLESVTTPNQPHGRANTRDTVISWLNTKPKPGSVLVISSQPTVAYQDAAVKSVMPAGFAVETVGARVAEDDLKISVALDAIARQIDVGFPKLLEALKTQPAAQPALRMIEPARIEADPATYQFRFNADGKSGETKEHAFTADRWDPILHGDPLLVHERLDGRLFVADGHHRLQFAKRLNAAGRGPDKLAALVLREADGYTPQDVKIIAAYKNLAQGHVKPAEAALVLKEAESGHVNKALLPKLDLTKGYLGLSYTLSKLSRPSLDLIIKGDVPVSMAAEVVKRVSDPARQDNVMRIISAKLQQNYDNYVAQDILSGSHGLQAQPQSRALSIGRKPEPTPAANSNTIMPGFMARLRQQRAEATAAAGAVLG